MEHSLDASAVSVPSLHQLHLRWNCGILLLPQSLHASPCLLLMVLPSLTASAK